MSEPRVFTVIRRDDESGVSGRGRVIDGFVAHNGKTIIVWRTDVDAAKHGFSSIGIYDSYEAFFAIHIAAHPKNDTEIMWLG
jgi:hypothetical protein